MRTKLILPFLFATAAAMGQEMADVPQTISTMPGGTDLVSMQPTGNQPVVRGTMPQLKTGALLRVAPGPKPEATEADKKQVARQ
jgi:hypothetical protein